MILLENEQVKATFLQRGAELKSLYSKETALEYLWDSNPAFWAKSSPVLFPIVGALKDDTYRYRGVDYQLPRHGFARDLDFEVNQVSDREVTFSLESNAALKEIYPFDFVLRIRYTLEDASLTCSYEVQNPAGEILLFSIGAHPAFKVPLVTGTTYTQHYLQFNKDSDLTFYEIKDNLIDDKTRTLALKDGKLPLSHSLFVNDALVFKTLQSDQIALLNTENEHGLRFTFKDFPFFGIWAAKDADFVCLEPWCGIADGVGHQGELESKEGMIALAPAECWRKDWNIALF